MKSLLKKVLILGISIMMLSSVGMTAYADRTYYFGVGVQGNDVNGWTVYAIGGQPSDSPWIRYPVKVTSAPYSITFPSTTLRVWNYTSMHSGDTTVDAYIKNTNINYYLDGTLVQSISHTNPNYSKYKTYRQKYTPYYSDYAILGKTISGLTPNTRYTFTAQGNVTLFNGYGGTGSEMSTTIRRHSTQQNDYFDERPDKTCPYYDNYNNYIYTEACTPTISFSGVTNNQLTVNWNPNGNSSTTTYILQKFVGATWTEIYKGANTSFPQTGLSDETTYQYRVIVKHVSGDSNWDISTMPASITTSLNPAVAAAREAAAAAQAAKLSADAAASNTAEAKSAALAAQNSAEKTFEIIKKYMKPVVIRTITGKDINEVIPGDINGSADGINAVSDSGYTILTGSLSLSDPTAKVEIKKVIIDGTTLYFKIVAPPTISSVATINFGS